MSSSDFGEATLNERTSYPERVGPAGNPHPDIVEARIFEIRNVTLKEALELVRALADRPEASLVMKNADGVAILL